MKDFDKVLEEKGSGSAWEQMLNDCFDCYSEHPQYFQLEMHCISIGRQPSNLHPHSPLLRTIKIGEDDAEYYHHCTPTNLVPASGILQCPIITDEMNENNNNEFMRVIGWPIE